MEGGTFVASEVLAKHDESYMPKEVADALKEQGLFRGDEGAAAEAGELTPDRRLFRHGPNWRNRARVAPGLVRISFLPKP